MPRRPLDLYETPPHYVAALLGEVNVFGVVYEPCVGNGAISGIVRRLGSVRHVFTNDINSRMPADTHEDAVFPDAWPGKMDWAITNPPFLQEAEILEQALNHVPNVAFLARLSFLEPCNGRDVLLENDPPNQLIILPRYSFRTNDEGKRQTDNVTCCWMVWYADRQPRRTAVWPRARAEAYAVMKGWAE